MSAQPGSEAPLPPELRPSAPGDPQRIGPYTVVGRLGAGGMGTVFGALDDSGACIAVKVIHERYADDAAFRSAFAREVELMRRVRGAYTVAVHAADTEAARPWVATDFVPGVTVRAHVERQGPLEPDMLLAFAAGTAEAVTAIHAAGIVHCDIKPGNVMLTPDGPRILDFGIARPVARSEADRSRGRVFGSPGWVSPERYRGAEPAPPTDVFAWGCMVAYAASGRPPFGRGDAAELRRRVLETVPDLDSVPGELRPMVELAAAADPAARPTAESAYRGLIDFSTSEETSHVQTGELVERLRDLVSRSWRGIDAGWHDPALWAAAVPALGTAGGTAVAAGAGAGAAASGAGTAGGAGAGGAAAATGMAAGTKVAVLSASAVLVVGGISAGGYLAANALTESDTTRAAQIPSPSPPPELGPPEEIVAGIVGNLESADSYHATFESSPGEGLAGWEEYVLATVDGEEVFQSVSIAGSPDSPESAMDRIYRPERERLIEREWHGADSGGSYTAASDPMSDTVARMQSRAAVLAPFESLAESMEADERTETELDGTPAVRIAGTFALATPEVPGQETLPGLEFELWTAMDGFPLRLDYRFTSEDPLVGSTSQSWTYTGFDGLDSRVCGSVEGVARVDRALLVPTVGRIACGDARAAVEEYLAMPDDEKEGTGYLAEVDGGWTCGLSATAEVLERTSETAGTCYAGELGAAERIDFIRMD